MISIKNYKYHVQLNKAVIPDELWQQARSMNQLWNRFAEVRERFLESVKDLYEDKARNREELKLRWKEFDNSLVEITRHDEWKAQLGWEAREAVIERFRTASARALKTGAEIRFKSHRLSNISIYHRFTGGGLETNKIFNGKSKKLKLAALPPEVYADESHQNRRHKRFSKGVFGIGLSDAPLPISVYVHRPVPKGKLKTAQLVGTFKELTREWSWTLVLAIETVDVDYLSEIKPIAALDINWRRLGDYLRIGYLKDTAGNTFEVRLPLVEDLSRRAKNTVRRINDARRSEGKSEFEFKDLFPRDFLQIQEWQARNDERKDQLKDQVKTIYETFNSAELPEHARSFLQHFARIGRIGLLKLKWQLDNIAGDSQSLVDEAKIKELLAEWQEKDRRERLSIHQTHKYLAHKRKKVYENIVLWLRKNYSYLIWEGDLSLKEMAESAPKISLNSKDVAIKLGNKYRQYAGLSVLRSKIKEHNRDNWLINVKAAKTTTTCRICGENCTPTGNLLIQCAKGHVSDVDEQSCDNMLKQTPETIVYQNRREQILVPEHLKNIIAPLSSSFNSVK